MYLLFKKKPMIYQIETCFYENCQKTYYADSFKSAYEIFKKLGNKLIRTSLFIKGKMYERKEGDVRHGVYYSGFKQESKAVEITMKPYYGSQQVKLSTLSEAMEDLHWAIFNKELTKCVPGINDIKFYYGNKQF